MTSLIAYQKFIDAVTTHTLRLPDAPMGTRVAQEIATLPDGRTVVCLHVGFELPTDQPAKIADSIEVLPTPLPTDLRDAIRAACPMVRVINARVQAAIAERYSIEDEIKLLRTAPSSAMAAYNDFAEDCRAWGRAEKSKIGL